MAEEDPYSQWPARELGGTVEAGKPAEAAKTPDIPTAVKSHLPSSMSEVWNELSPRAEYVGKRFVKGLEESSSVPFPWKPVDVGESPDMLTQSVGNWAHDFGRNPLLTGAMTVLTPGLTVADAAWTTAADRLGLPEWEKLVGGGLLGLKRGAGIQLHDLWNTLRHTALGAGIGHTLFGPVGAKIGGILEGGVPFAQLVGRRMAANPTGAAVMTAAGAYQAEPESGPLLNALTRSHTPLMSIQ